MDSISFIVTELSPSILPNYCLEKINGTREVQKKASITHSSQSWNTLGCAHPKSPQDYRTQAPLSVKIRFINRNILPVGSAELGHTECFKIGIFSPDFMYKYMHTLLLKTWTELKATFGHW